MTLPQTICLFLLWGRREPERDNLSQADEVNTQKILGADKGTISEFSGMKGIKTLKYT